MGEAILVKAGGLGGNGGSDPEDQNIVDWQLKTELITESKEFIVPKAKNQQFSVRIFGGGGGCTCINMRETISSELVNTDKVGWQNSNSWATFGGGSGNMNYNQLKLTRGDIIPIVIGTRGDNGGVGTTTSFGNYLSATGGTPIDFVNRNGGNGGVGTPPFIITDCYFTASARYNFISGAPVFKFNGGKSTYGGGSGFVAIRISNHNNICISGTNGGIYGGGGATYDGDPVKTGGNGCGNGGNGSLQPEDGTNTTDMILDFVGNGNRGKIYVMGSGQIDSVYAGGGGYGGCGGGNGSYNNAFYGGGGGGYAGNGTSGAEMVAGLYGNDVYDNRTTIFFGGFGGGYGSNLENSSYWINNNGMGGAGYGKSEYGGGGKFSNSFAGMMPPFSPISNCMGKNGICILTYYAPVYNNG